MRIDPLLLVWRLASPAKAAGHSWFSAAHVALMVSIAALAVSTVLGVISLRITRNSAASSKRSADAAEDSAAAARVSAKAAEDLLDIEREREYDRLRPKLRGCLAPAPGEPDPTNAWLEVHLDASTPQPLLKLLLTVPTGAWFARGRMLLPTRMRNDFGFPEASWQIPPIRGWTCIGTKTRD